MLAITYSMKKEIKAAKWGKPKKQTKKTLDFSFNSPEGFMARL
jgi:hypothetical protein